MLCCVILVTSVDVLLREVTLGTVCQYPNFDFTFDWLHGHVLFETRTPLIIVSSTATSLPG